MLPSRYVTLLEIARSSPTMHRSTKNSWTAEFKRVGVKTLARNKSYCTMRRFQLFNHGQRKGSTLDDAAEALGVSGRTGIKHDASEDTRITFEIAGLFYMMDNGIRIPRWAAQAA